ncbi:MAG: RHS repeat-associated core domain-containing protein [Sphingomonas sp.]|nr:RHS repeat-associated core domain-containing protein [Sphingomonas sp.]
MSGSTYDFTHSFTYNPAGQIASNTRSNDLYAWAGHFNVDRSYTNNGLNQATAAGATSLSYDSRGNLTTSGSDSYGYTSENLLTSGPSSVTLAYDPAMRLYQTAGVATTRFQYDGTAMIGEYNTSGTLLRRYVPGPGTDEPLAWYEGSGTSDRRWLHADERGSVVAVSNASGVVTNVNTYDEYGIPGSGNVGRFQYTGQAWLPELGMSYYKARIYSPTLGRFMQNDSIGYYDGMNWYNYVGSDPVNRRDPSGFRECIINEKGEGNEDCYIQVDGRLIDPFPAWENYETDYKDTDFGQNYTTNGDVIMCRMLKIKITGVGPNQANSNVRTAISQQPGNTILNGSVAIDPSDFGVPNARGEFRSVLARIKIYPQWSGAEQPSNGAPAMPVGLPSTGPYNVVDVIAPPSARNQPGVHIDLYRYTSTKNAFASTRIVPTIFSIPVNDVGVTCPTG